MMTAPSIYQGLLRAVVRGLEAFPPKRIEREEIELRKGLYQPESPIPPEGTIWVHGASLGEVITLRPFLRLLNRKFGPDRLLCTTTTLDGYRRVVADGLCGHASLLPIDLPEYIDPFIETMRPRLILISETEIWPIWPARATAHDIPLAIINARINESTVRLIRLFRSLFSGALEGITHVFPQELVYERRYRALGFPPERTRVLGAFKYDLELPAIDREALRTQYGIPAGRRIIVAGSTHEGEEAILLDALEPLWTDLHATLIIAPRHMNRVGDVETLLRTRQLDVTKLSSHPKQTGRILLVDTLGELQKLYMTADLAFVGGSLIPRGGHNLMEPAAAGVPLFTGPHLGNFPSEHAALTEANAMRITADIPAVRELFRAFIADREPFAAMGRRALGVQRRMAGAGRKTLDALSELGLLPDGQA
ncbi:MAG TPA: glycosyltransferase N-terminal domain-containing protein [Candidatus Ozemobacteraceae bacterium]|nr:glycosyltransferase N-terminal domain-containing protein [Candidatus Ozemobacteraceae bacterium]